MILILNVSNDGKESVLMNNNRKIEAIFLDRDGTIGGDHTVHYPGTFELYSHSSELISKLKNDGIKVFSFTNQPGISEGKATSQEFIEELTKFVSMIFLFVHIASLKVVIVENPTQVCLS